MNLVHVIPNLGPGGPTRSLTTFIEWAVGNRPGMAHRILTLEPRTYPLLAMRLRRYGAVILQDQSAEQVDATLAAADAVLVHFWNTPPMWRLLARRAPPVRAVIWALIRGDHPPQRLNAELLRSAAGVVLTAAPPAHLVADFAQAPIVPGLIQKERVACVAPRAHDGFRITYVGTTNGGKLDDQIFSIVADLAIPGVTLRLHGGALEPAMARAHAAMPDPSRVEVRGFTENIAEAFATTDVFAFPMAADSYSAGDLALQEAMLAGLPVVVYAGRGSSRLVEHGRTGLVAADAAEFGASLERLHRDAALRAALGAAAKAHAEAAFDPCAHAARLASAIDATAAAAKRPLFAARTPAADHGGLTSGALFLVSQGWDKAEAADAVAAWMAGQDDRLNDFALAASDNGFTVEGGIVHWRNHAPDDALLRAWSGQWLLRSGRPEAAQAEFDAALRLGADAGTLARLATP